MAALHADSTTDVATSSNFRQVLTQHVQLDLNVDMDRKQITGKECLSLISKESDVVEGIYHHSLGLCLL